MKFHTDGTKPKPSENVIFVFGSNLSGIHGAGAAKEALLSFGAKRGVGRGLVGNSYAIPTKGKHLEFIPLTEIMPYVHEFVLFTKKRPDLEFWITRVGCGLAGFRDADIAPLFRGCGDNCSFPEPWKPFLT